MLYLPNYSIKFYRTVLLCFVSLNCFISHLISFCHVLYCIVLYYIILHYIMLYYVILHYIVLHYIVLYYIISHYSMFYYVILHYIVLYYIASCYIIYHIVLNCIVLCSVDRIFLHHLIIFESPLQFLFGIFSSYSNESHNSQGACFFFLIGWRNLYNRIFKKRVSGQRRIFIPPSSISFFFDEVFNQNINLSCYEHNLSGEDCTDLAHTQSRNFPVDAGSRLNKDHPVSEE